MCVCTRICECVCVCCMQGLSPDLDGVNKVLYKDRLGCGVPSHAKTESRLQRLAPRPGAVAWGGWRLTMAASQLTCSALSSPTPLVRP